MTDSLWKDVVDLLAAGTWTNHGTTPACKQVTESERGTLLTIAYENKANSACVIVIPPEVESKYENGNRSVIYTFETHVFRFPATIGADVDQDKLQGLINDIQAILKAAVVANADDNYLSTAQNLTNRRYARQQQDNRHLYAVVNIMVEAWVA